MVTDFAREMFYLRNEWFEALLVLAISDWPGPSWVPQAAVAEVGQTHLAFLRVHGGSARVRREVLLELPQLSPVRRAERGVSRRLLAIDRAFRRWAPASRLVKLLAGPTITDIAEDRRGSGWCVSRLAPELVGALQARATGALRRLRGCQPN